MVIQFFNGNALENVNAIFGSQETIEEYKKFNKLHPELAVTVVAYEKLSA